MRILYWFIACFFVLSCAPEKKVETVAVLGDSYSTFYGYIPEGNDCWYYSVPQGENDVVNVEQTWWHLFCHEGGYELVLNESFSGSTICNTGYDGVDYKDRSFITRMTNITSLEELPDLILIFGGTNDSWADSPVGELVYENWSPEDMYSCLPACCFMLEHLTTEAPESIIIVLMNTEIKEEITVGIKQACDHYGVHFLQLQDIEKKWGHPSVKGMEQIKDQLQRFLAEVKYL